MFRDLCAESAPVFGHSVIRHIVGLDRVARLAAGNLCPVGFLEFGDGLSPLSLLLGRLFVCSAHFDLAPQIHICLPV